MEEADVLTCPHCEAVIFLQTWRKEREQGGGNAGGFCRKCMAPICGPCHNRWLTEGCVPFIKTVDEAVEANYRRQQNMKILGI